jgi:hypothetical protein
LEKIIARHEGGCDLDQEIGAQVICVALQSLATVQRIPN